MPCEAIYEPDWRTGKLIPTRFTAANDETLGVAGLWAPWKNPETAEWELRAGIAAGRSLTISAVRKRAITRLLSSPILRDPSSERR